MKDIEKIIRLLDEALQEDSVSNITEGNIIKDGYDKDIDAYRSTISQSHEWLTQYQKKLIDTTSITSLKIKYTHVSGYFIEIPKSQISKISDDFIHKQTLVNAARYVTIELQKFEQDVSEAQNNMASKEYEVFQKVRENVLEGYSHVKASSRKVAYLDFIASLSDVSYKRNYVCPEVHNGYGIEVIGGRHPVIEEIEKDFVANDLHLDSKDFIHIITGPNMGGKSTFLRQNALLVILAHIGSYVPAKQAKIGMVDKVFSRVGAQDNLFLGKSTFMVEMQEISNILNNSTAKSFIIIDEIGRGTSTYDGMSLAWAILHSIHRDIRAKTLFATHYHEIIDESEELKHASNYSVAVGENQENLIFLRKIIPGGIKKSYGLEVAKLAGIDTEIIQEAKKMIQKQKIQGFFDPQQLSLESESSTLSDEESEIIEELKKLDIDSITPIDALNKLLDFKKISEKQ